MRIVSEVIAAGLGLYALAIIAMMLMSWFPMRPGGGAAQFYRTLQRVTDPAIGPVRRSIPTMGPIDVAPLVVVLVLLFLRSLILG